MLDTVRVLVALIHFQAFVMYSRPGCCSNMRWLRLSQYVEKAIEEFTPQPRKPMVALGRGGRRMDSK